MLTLNRFGPATLADLFTLVAHLRHEVRKKPHVRLKSSRSRIDLRSQVVVGIGVVHRERFVSVSHGICQLKNKITSNGIPAERNRAMRLNPDSFAMRSSGKSPRRRGRRRSSQSAQASMREWRRSCPLPRTSRELWLSRSGAPAFAFRPILYLIPEPR